MKKEIKMVLIVLVIILLLVGMIGGIMIGLNKRSDVEETNIINKENQNNDFSYFEEFKNMEYYGTDGIDSCVLKFDKYGKPLINVKYKNGTNETVDDFTNIIVDGAAGSTYVTFDFKGLSSNGNTLFGNGTIKYSNVSVESAITITLEYSTGTEKIFDVYRTLNNQNIISKEEAQKILENKYGTKDSETGNIISYSYLAKVKDKNENEYYYFRQSWIVEEHTSFLQNIFISLDGKTIKASDKPEFFEDGDIIEEKITDLSQIENLLKSKGNYEYLRIKNIKENNGKYLVEADYYVQTSITEKEYSEMKNNKKITLNNKEYMFDNSNRVYSTEYGTVYIEGESVESGYWIEKINGKYIFINEIGGVYNTINEIKENYLFYLDKNTKVSEITSDVEDINLDSYLSKNSDLVEYFTTVIYNDNNNEISVLVDKR